MAHDLTDLHALAGGVGASLRFGGRHVPTAAGPWNVAAGGAAEGKWGALTGEAASVLDRLAALLPAPCSPAFRGFSTSFPGLFQQD